MMVSIAFLELPYKFRTFYICVRSDVSQREPGIQENPVRNEWLYKRFHRRWDWGGCYPVLNCIMPMTRAAMCRRHDA